MMWEAVKLFNNVLDAEPERGMTIAAPSITRPKAIWFTRNGIGCISLLVQRVKSEIPVEFYFTSRR